MFLKTSWLILILWYYDAVGSSVYASDEQTVLFSKEMLRDPQKWTTNSRKSSERKLMDENSRVKRGIVLVDEDFNVPAKPGVKHGWSENESSNDEMLDAKEEKEKIITEGSGDEIITEDLITSSSIKSQVKTTQQFLPTMSHLQSTDFDGSGDDAISYSTPEHDVIDLAVAGNVPEICLNTTCGSDELAVHTEYEGIVPQGANLTISCIMKNKSLNDVLYFYRNNGSLYSLQTFAKYYELHFDMPDIKFIHSGTYICVKRVSNHSCCHRELQVIVYEVPAYKYHLLVIIIITAACLLACILLGVWRSLTLKKYTKQFVKVQSNQKPLLI